MRSSFLQGATLCAILLAASQVPAVVDPNNMGKGDWIYDLPTAITAAGQTTLQGLIDYEKAKGIKYLVVNCGRGGTWYTQFSSDLVTRCHTTGVQIFGYERCFGDDVTAEANVGKQCLGMGPDGFIINAEIEYEGKNSQATSMMNNIRATYPNAFVGHAPFVYIDWHTAFPYVEFGKQCNAVFPQCYWRAAGINKPPDQMVADMNTQWNKWHDTWTSQGNGAAVKPVVPLGDGYNTTSASEVPAFFDNLNATTQSPNPSGYKGVSWWSAQHHTTAHWTNIGNGVIGTQPIVVDNSSSSFSASSNWATGTSATDKYGSDYRYRPTAAISDSATWTLAIPCPGTYDLYAWWAQGSNRANHPAYTLTDNTTIQVNQQTNGGKWNLLGSKTISAAGNVTMKVSCWTTTGQTVIADAVRAVKH